MFQEDSDFSEEFKRVFNNSYIPEADYFTSDVLEETYVNMEISLSRYLEGTRFDKVIKCLQDSNSIPIGRHNYNPVLDTRVYEVG